MIETLFVDLNGVLMHEHDRLGKQEDYETTYRSLGGIALQASEVSEIVSLVVERMSEFYDDWSYDDQFPSVKTVIGSISSIADDECSRLADVIAHHEMGVVSEQIQHKLHELSANYKLVLVSNIWSGSRLWRQYFAKIGVLRCFSLMIFSSDIGINKPSPRIFQHALRESDSVPNSTMMIGDDWVRDIAPAASLGMTTTWINRDVQELSADYRIDEFLDIDQALTSILRS